MTAKLESIIEKAWDERANVSIDTKGEVRDSVEEALAMRRREVRRRMRGTRTAMRRR